MIKLGKEESTQLLFPLLTKIYEACDGTIIDGSTREAIIDAAFDSILLAFKINPEGTITFLGNIIKERSPGSIAGRAIRILAEKAEIKLAEEDKPETWLTELGLEHLKEKALQSVKREES